MSHVEYQLAVRDFQGGGGLVTKPPPSPPYADRCYCQLEWWEKTARTMWSVRNEHLYGPMVRRYAECKEASHGG